MKTLTIQETADELRISAIHVMGLVDTRMLEAATTTEGILISRESVDQYRRLKANGLKDTMRELGESIRKWGEILEGANGENSSPGQR